MKQRGLGKGLSALIPEKESSTLNKDLSSQEQSRQITWIKTALISVNRYQPREDFGSEKMVGLISSIKEKGLIQPVLVRKSGESYELICGERRLRAAKTIGMEEVPVIIKDVSDVESLELSLKTF